MGTAGTRQFGGGLTVGYFAEAIFWRTVPLKHLVSQTHSFRIWQKTWEPLFREASVDSDAFIGPFIYICFKYFFLLTLCYLMAQS